MNSKNVKVSDGSLHKSNLRLAFREKANQHLLHSPQRSAQQTALAHRVKSLLTDLRATGIWGSFQPIGAEPDIRPIMRDLERDAVISWAYPRVEGDSLTFYLVTDSTTMIANRWGILEPDPLLSPRVEADAFQGLIIPGVAFDLHCQRLGRGRGFYDRTLAHFKLGKVKIGVAFETQISVEPLPTESFDVAMDWVVTESRVLQRAVTLGHAHDANDEIETGRKNL